MPDLSQYYTIEDIEEYLEYGITRVMLQEASIDVSEYVDSDLETLDKPSASKEFFCSVRFMINFQTI